MISSWKMDLFLKFQALMLHWRRLNVLELPEVEKVEFLKSSQNRPLFSFEFLKGIRGGYIVLMCSDKNRSFMKK
ncbi:hypothetical protein SLEP1_g15894 [Rubroshorea leprosula]|uniref:Uncharacterized protein n=1 Tax=Rubroshorea leprosula TaxID=152421 RepID=A0AAV5IYA2_9ROSI|nr:hypothetical protein SLEP1_g15894 [Rubroshorea leprosula]